MLKLKESYDSAMTLLGKTYSTKTGDYPIRKGTQGRTHLKTKIPGGAVMGTSFWPATQRAAVHLTMPDGKLKYIPGSLVFHSETEVDFIPRTQAGVIRCYNYDRTRVPSDHMPKRLKMAEID